MWQRATTKVESNTERDNVANILNVTDPATHIIGGIVWILDLMFCFSIIDGTPAIWVHHQQQKERSVCQQRSKTLQAAFVCVCMYGTVTM
jgi:hypothetical protein